MNVLTFTGRLTRDSELRYLADQTQVLSFSVANNTGFGDKQKTNYFECSLFGQRAGGKLVEYLKKGQEVGVSGEISLNEYKSASGENKASMRVRVNDVTLIGSKSAAPDKQSQPAQQTRDNFEYDDDLPY